MLKRLVNIVLNERRKHILRKKVKFKSGVQITSNTFFAGKNAVSYNSILKGCWIGTGTYLGASNDLAGVRIGRFSSIGSRVSNAAGRHPTNTFVSTHPAFFSLGKQAGFTYVKKNKFKELHTIDPEGKYLVEIGNDVWVGDNVVFMDGLTIGDGAIIGAGAIVTKNVPPYSINVGCPAKTIGYRFNEKEIELLLLRKWWDNSEIWISENAENFDSIEKLYGL